MKARDKARNIEEFKSYDEEVKKYQQKVVDILDVSQYKKTKTMLENTISEINTRIRLFDSNPSPNSLKMASQLEKQKQDWQNQLDNLEAKYKEYRNRKKGN